MSPIFGGGLKSASPSSSPSLLTHFLFPSSQIIYENSTKKIVKNSKDVVVSTRVRQFSGKSKIKENGNDFFLEKRGKNQENRKKRKSGKNQNNPENEKNKKNLENGEIKKSGKWKMQKSRKNWKIGKSKNQENGEKSGK